MKDFLEKLMTDDETRQKFTKKEVFIYGFVVPAAFIGILFLTSLIELL